MYGAVAHGGGRRSSSGSKGATDPAPPRSTPSSSRSSSRSSSTIAAEIRPRSRRESLFPFQRSGRRESVAVRLYTFVKHQFSQDKEEDLDEFNIHVVRHRPEELNKLANSTKFTRKEIQLIYRGFKQECPTGMVDEDSFKHIFSQFFPQGDASQYAHYVFNTIKHNQSGKISFEDFLGILSKVSRGSVQEKLQWVFGLYDQNGDGLITQNEMLDVVSSIYEMLGRSTDPVVEEGSAREHVEKIFHQIDTNKDGVVTIDELVEWCSRDETILQSLETLDTVL